MISILKVADEIIKNAALTHMNSMDQSHIAQGELTFVKTMLFIGHFTVDPFFLSQCYPRWRDFTTV